MYTVLCKMSALPAFFRFFQIYQGLSFDGKTPNFEDILDNEDLQECFAEALMRYCVEIDPQSMTQIQGITTDIVAQITIDSQVPRIEKIKILLKEVISLMPEQEKSIFNTVTDYSTAAGVLGLGTQVITGLNITFSGFMILFLFILSYLRQETFRQKIERRIDNLGTITDARSNGSKEGLRF